MQLEDWEESAKKAKAAQAKAAPTSLELLRSINAQGREILEQIRDANTSLREIASATERSARHLFWLALPIYISVVIGACTLIGFLYYLVGR
jgi:hypothetical protein